MNCVKWQKSRTTRAVTHLAANRCSTGVHDDTCLDIRSDQSCHFECFACSVNYMHAHNIST
jgi:hypothetical protein